MRVENIPEWALGAADERALADLLERAFGGPARPSGFNGRSFFQQRHHLRLLVRDGGTVVGHMALLYRAVRLGGRLLDIVGLAEVAIAPDRRGEGIAGRLMNEAIAFARHTRAEFLLLFGDRPLYAGVGFVPYANPMRWTAMDGARTGEIRREPAEALMVLPLGATPWDGAAELDLMGAIF